MEKYIRLKDIEYSMFNIGRIILLKPNSDGYYTIKEEMLNCQFRNSKLYSKLYVCEITPYYETVDFDKTSIRVNAKLQITVIEDDAK